MSYRGVVQNGVVVIDGEKPAEGTVVEVRAVASELKDLAELPAFGIWRDREDLPADSGEASGQLRSEAERRGSARL